MIRQVLLLWVLASLLGLLILSDDVPLPHEQVTGEYYGVNNSVIISQSNDMIPQSLQDVLQFDAENALTVDTTSLLNQTVDFIVVYENEPNPIFEWCYTAGNESCTDPLTICFGESCSGAMFSFTYDHIPIFTYHFEPHNLHLERGECAKIRTIDGDTFELQTNTLNYNLSEFKLDSRPFPQNESLTQLIVRFSGSTCGAVVKFPKVSLAYSDSVGISSSSTPESQTSSNESPTNASNGGLNGITSTKASTSSAMTTWEYLAIIGGSVFGVICILVIVVVIFCIRRRRNRKAQKKPSKSGKKIIKLRGTRSMDSVMAPAVPVAAPQQSKAVKTDSTQQPSAIQISLTKLQTEPTQPSASAVTAAEKTADLAGVEKLKPGPAAPIKLAEERTQDLDDELSLLQTAIPKMVVDASKPFSKLYASDFVWNVVDVVQQEYPQPKIIPFLTQKIVDKCAPPSQYTPDGLVEQAIRLPNVEERAAMIFQAAIQANNQLYDLGFRRKKHYRGPHRVLEHYVSGPPASEKWLKNLEGGDFLRFIVEAAAKDIGGKRGEFEEDSNLWRQYLYIIDVRECLRQACLYGQSTERRHYFTLALFYQMAMLVNDSPDEKIIEKLAYPVPMLLGLYREARHYFAVEYTVSTEGTAPQE